MGYNYFFIKLINIFYLLPLIIVTGLIVPFNSNDEVSTNSTMNCDDCVINQIAFGGSTSAMIMDGDLWMWGSNEFGQLGDGTNVDKDIPTKITGEDSANPDLNGEVSKVSVGVTHSAMIMDGDLWMWGNNDWGQLGDGTSIDRSTPRPITGENSANPLLDDEVNQVALGRNYSAMVMDGDLWMWGDNQFGQLGDGTTTERNTPKPITGEVSANPTLTGDVTQVALGDFHSGIIIDEDLYMWGSNQFGQLGDGNTSILPYSTPIPITGTGSPLGLEGDVSQISFGQYHSGMIMDGDLWTWGANIFGQLGDGTNADKNEPIQITGNGGTSGLSGNISQISLSNEQSGMIMDGNLWMWGYNSFGQLGDNSYFSKDTPTPITGEDSANPELNGEVKKVSIGSFHAGMLMNGDLYMWGNDTLGQLGNGEDGDSAFPTLVIDAVESSTDELNLALIIGVSVGAFVLIVLLGVGGYFIMARR